MRRSTVADLNIISRCRWLFQHWRQVVFACARERRDYCAHPLRVQQRWALPLAPTPARPLHSFGATQRQRGCTASAFWQWVAAPSQRVLCTALVGRCWMSAQTWLRVSDKVAEHKQNMAIICIHTERLRTVGCVRNGVSSYRVSVGAPCIATRAVVRRRHVSRPRVSASCVHLDIACSQSAPEIPCCCCTSALPPLSRQTWAKCCSGPPPP